MTNVLHLHLWWPGVGAVGWDHRWCCETPVRPVGNMRFLIFRSQNYLQGTRWKQDLRKLQIKPLVVGVFLLPTSDQIDRVIKLFLFCSLIQRYFKITIVLFFFLPSHLPKIYQSFLMSATLSEDVQALKELLLHNPVLLFSPAQPQRCYLGSPFPLCLISCRLSGHPEAPGLTAAGQQSAAAVQHQVWGGGQVPAHLHAAEAAVGSGQDAGVCWSTGQMLQAQTLPGAVWCSCLRTQLRVACAVQVGPLVLVIMQCKAAV